MLDDEAISPRTSPKPSSTAVSRAIWPQTSCWRIRGCHLAGTSSGQCLGLLEPVRTQRRSHR